MKIIFVVLVVLAVVVDRILIFAKIIFPFMWQPGYFITGNL